MKYIKCPDSMFEYDWWPNHRRIFLAGGITGCSDWQSLMASYLDSTDLIVVNPRRGDYTDQSKPFDAPAEGEQVKWERTHLEQCQAHLFWFPETSVCPITLFELGTIIFRSRQLFIGIHRSYPKRTNLMAQLSIIKDFNVVTNLNALALQVIHWSENAKQDLPF